MPKWAEKCWLLLSSLTGCFGVAEQYCWSKKSGDWKRSVLGEGTLVGSCTTAPSQSWISGYLTTSTSLKCFAHIHHYVETFCFTFLVLRWFKHQLEVIWGLLPILTKSCHCFSLKQSWDQKQHFPSSDVGFVFSILYLFNQMAQHIFLTINLYWTFIITIIKLLPLSPQQSSFVSEKDIVHMERLHFDRLNFCASFVKVKVLNFFNQYLFGRLHSNYPHLGRFALSNRCSDSWDEQNLKLNWFSQTSKLSKNIFCPWQFLDQPTNQLLPPTHT